MGSQFRARMETALRKYVLDLESCGPTEVFMEGEEKLLKEGMVFLTVHDVGSSFQTIVNFSHTSAMEEIRQKSVFLHVSVPGQEPQAKDLPKDFAFPTMAQLGVALVTILDQLRVHRVVGIGDGAGANVITRFAMMHPSRCHGIITINNTATTSHDFMERLKEKMNRKHKETSLNERNVTMFSEAFKKRKEILSELNTRIKSDMLLMAGTKSKYVTDTETIHRDLTPGLCSMIKVEDVVDPLQEAPWKVAEALLLFCQGMSLLPTVARRMSMSRQETAPSIDTSQRASCQSDCRQESGKRTFERQESEMSAELSF